MAQVKGTAVESSLRYVREQFGAQALDCIVMALPAETRRLLKDGILASSWYPMEALLRFMRETERQLGTREPEVLRKMGRASCEYGVRGVYKIFFRFGSPEFVISRSTHVFSSYYDSGELRVVESRAGRAVGEVSGLTESSPEFCARMLGWMERTLELSGAKNLRSSHSACVHRGDAVCRFEGIWDAKG